MVKELYQFKSCEIALNVTNGAVDSVRKKNITKSGCRVYENGCIGICGTLGEATEETWRKAEAALQTGVPYPYAPTGDLKRRRVQGEMPDEAEFLKQSEKLLATLKEEFPEFILSNKIYASLDTVSLKNDIGLDLEDVQAQVAFALVVKEERSANIFDSFIAWDGKKLDTDAVLEQARQLLRAHKNPVDLPEGRLPVLMGAGIPCGILADYLNIQKLKKGVSLLSEKMGTQAFSEKLTVSAYRGEEKYSAFFDAEGTVLPNDTLPLIEGGVVVRGLADKKNAAEYGADLTANGYADYDDVPQLAGAPSWMKIHPTGTFEEVLGTQDSVFVVEASGGDITPSGDFATPVQTAYLCRGGKLVGRLPELNFRGNIFDLLGKDYLGCCKGASFEHNPLVALYGTLTK